MRTKNGGQFTCSAQGMGVSGPLRGREKREKEKEREMAGEITQPDSTTEEEDEMQN